MRKFLLAILLGICFIPVFSQTTYNGTLTNKDATFNRPNEGVPPVTLSPVGTSVYYNLITMNVPTAGLITINCNSIWDNFSILYSSGGFSRTAPLLNALQANDDFSGPNSGFTYNFTSTGTYYLVICSFKNFVTGDYIITTSAPVVLPLKLLSFTASKAGGKSNIIKWISAEESNLNSYQVQRRTDDNNFVDLTDGNVIAKNNAFKTDYSYMDNYPVTGYNYYRIKITERTGKISYSPVALVKNIRPVITNLKVFPNPASDYLQIELKSMLNKKAFISIINSGGEIIQNGQYSFNEQAIISVDIKKLPAGKYFLKTTIDKDETTIAFIKK